MDALTTTLVMSVAKRSRTLLRSHSDGAPPLCMFSTILPRMRRVSGKASLHVDAVVIILDGTHTVDYISNLQALMMSDGHHRYDWL